MLEARGLTVSYGGIAALRGVDLAVAEGTMVALIGPNGAGKSTLLNALSGIVKPLSGSVLFKGEDIAGRRPHEIARRGLVQVPEGRQILGPLSVEENLQLGAIAAATRPSSDPWTHERVCALFPILAERRGQEGGSLSGGQQQMLAIGRALRGNPHLLMLDEPSLGLSPIMASQVFAALETLRRAGLTILLVEQNAKRALAVSDHAYVLEQGRIVQSGPSHVLASDPLIASHYLPTAGIPDR